MRCGSRLTLPADRPAQRASNQGLFNTRFGPSEPISLELMATSDDLDAHMRSIPMACPGSRRTIYTRGQRCRHRKRGLKAGSRRWAPEEITHG